MTFSKYNLLLRRILQIVIAANFLLLLLGVVIYPTVMNNGGLLGIVAATVILLVYGYIVLFSPAAIEKVPPELLKLVVPSGLVGGLLLGFDLVSDYLIEHDANLSSTSSLIAYGLLLLLLVITAIFATRLTGRLRTGLVAAFWYVVISLLLWFFIEFTAFYVFAQTPNGAKFIQLEMQTDFERSKASDFAGFVMSDFYGAGFFHLLLGLIMAGLLGAVGGGLGKLFRQKQTVQ